MKQSLAALAVCGLLIGCASDGNSEAANTDGPPAAETSDTATSSTQESVASASPTTTPPATTAPPETTTTAAPTTTEAIAGSWRSETTGLVGRVAHDGEVAVSVAYDGDALLELVAFDARMGEELWRAPYSTAGRFSGMGLGGFAVIDGVVAHAAGDPTDPVNASIVGREAVTGDELWELEAPFTFGVEPCGPVFCVSVFNPDTGEQVVGGIEPAGGNVRWIVDGTDVDYVTNDDLIVVLTVGDEPVLRGVEPDTGFERWVVNPEEALGGDMTTNWGWNFVRRDGVVTGYLGRPADEADALAATFGIDDTTGEVLWSRTDAQLSYWPTDLRALSAFVDDGDGWFDVISVEAFDLRTGEAISSGPPVSLPSDSDERGGLPFGANIGWSADGTVAVWTVDGEAVALDLTTGEATDAPEVIWKQTERDILDLTAIYGEANSSSWPAENRIGPVVAANDEPVELEPTAVPTFAGPTFGGWTLWLDPDGALNGVKTS